MDFIQNVSLKNRGCRFPGYYIEMYCHACGRFYTASNTGSACKYCRSSHVHPAGNYIPVRSITRTGRPARVL